MINTYVALDLETTGLNPATDRILEIGAVKIVNGEVTDTYETLVDAGVLISPMIQRLTGITNEMSNTGKATREAVTELITFCEDYPILGHNIQFDFSFVKKNAINHNLGFEKYGIDTLKIARVLLSDLEKKNLDFLCSYYQIDQTKKHRAAYDALAAKELYEKMWEQFPNSPRELFMPKELIYQVKKQGPITPAQKGYLNDLVKYHRIELDVRIDSLTKNEASRMIDRIILENGRISR